MGTMNNTNFSIGSNRNISRYYSMLNYLPPWHCLWCYSRMCDIESRILYLVNAIIITILTHMDTPYSADVALYSGEACVPAIAICDVPLLKGMLICRMWLLFSISANDVSRPSSNTAKGLSERKSLFLESIIFLPSSIVNFPVE